MATKTEITPIFGIWYRIRQFAAVRSLAIATAPDSDPLEMLERTEVRVGEEWIPLDSRAVVNKHVCDPTGLVLPKDVLKALLLRVGEHSCGAAKAWKGVKVPNRFTAEGQGLTTRESAYVDPVIAGLLGADMATLRELEEYYSLEDAMKMFDVMVAKGVNEALANEHAQKGKR